MQPSEISVRQEIWADIEREAESTGCYRSVVDPKTSVSKEHTLDMELDQMTTKVPMEYQVSYLNENTEAFF